MPADLDFAPARDVWVRSARSQTGSPRCAMVAMNGFLPQTAAFRVGEALESQVEQAQFPGNQQAIIHFARLKIRQVGQIRLEQKPVIYQPIKADQVRISGER